MGKNATLGTPSCAGPLHNRSDIFPSPHDEVRRTLTLEVLPSEPAYQVSAQWRLRHQNDSRGQALEIRRLRYRPPQVILDDEYRGLGVCQQLQLFRRGQLEIQRHKHTATGEDRIT